VPRVGVMQSNTGPNGTANHHGSRGRDQDQERHDALHDDAHIASRTDDGGYEHEDEDKARHVDVHRSAHRDKASNVDDSPSHFRFDSGSSPDSSHRLPSHGGHDVHVRGHVHVHDESSRLDPRHG